MCHNVWCLLKEGFCDVSLVLIYEVKPAIRGKGVEVSFQRKAVSKHKHSQIIACHCISMVSVYFHIDKSILNAVCVSMSSRHIIH